MADIDVTVKNGEVVAEGGDSGAPIVATVNGDVCAVYVLAANGKPIATLKVRDKESGTETPVNVATCTEAVVCSAGKTMQEHLAYIYGHTENADAHLTDGEKQNLETKEGAQAKATAARDEAITAASLDIASLKTYSEDYATEKATAARTAAYKYANGLFESHTNDNNNPHGVTAEQVGLGNVPNKATNDLQPTYTIAETLTSLSSGERLAVAFGKIAKAITDLIAHIGNKANPHGVSAAQVGAISTPVTVADMNTFTGTFGYVNGQETLNHPLSTNFGFVINRIMGVNRMQYIFYLASPGRIASRVQVDGVWHPWYQTYLSNATSTVED